jgi:hypothetical protein
MDANEEAVMLGKRLATWQHPAVMQPLQRFAQQMFGPHVKVDCLFPTSNQTDGFPTKMLP